MPVLRPFVESRAERFASPAWREEPASGPRELWALVETRVRSFACRACPCFSVSLTGLRARRSVGCSASPFYTPVFLSFTRRFLCWTPYPFFLSPRLLPIVCSAHRAIGDPGARRPLRASARFCSVHRAWGRGLSGIPACHGNTVHTLVLQA